jgi:nucleoside-diphosphate-sugar epimerase
VELLREDGHHVTGVDLDLYRESEIYRCALPDESRVMDLFELRPEDLRGFDAVMHLAAISNDAMGILNPALTWKVNYEGTLHVAECAKLAGVPRFFLSSSCSIYGKSGDKPLDETAPSAPISVYAETKIRSEESLAEMADKHFSPVYLRNATAYGTSPRLRIDLVLNNLLASAYAEGTIRMLSDGTPWRPLAHCRDIARAFVFFLTARRDVIHNQAFNIGSSEETYQVRDVAHVVKEVLPECELSFSDGAMPDPRDYKVDFSKLNRAFPEFKLQSKLRQGARELYSHYLRCEMPKDLLTNHRFIRLKTLKRKITGREVPAYFQIAEEPYAVAQAR